MLIICPKCSNEKNVKAGVINNRQRYKCKLCGYHFTVDNRSKPLKIKRLAIVMYLLGQSVRALSRTIGVSNVAALGWIRNYAGGIEKIRAKEPYVYASCRMEEIQEYLSEIPDKEAFTWCVMGIGENKSHFILIR
ncbi:MAG TPA: hypothetical protein P5050_10155 [Bacteroidia bacterium]|nr:hypothetical protein [Bacteroidia bacterium]HRS59572.1 hypothetical protein [Bacteroidia bacterium]HRU67639.1 hypothetical protein [Bacteroidia bacterium]